ncbi:MAG: zinc-binding dehydrogenase [Chloroflexi bacterium]|nr:zinc-binding dehydrogenase [Chloroflexota bacterium]
MITAPEDFVEVIRRMEPIGLDAVFDGMGGEYLRRGFSLLKRGGVWVGYANPRSLSGMFQLLSRVLWLNLLPNGRAVKLYGTGASFLDRRPFLEDWAALFRLLAEGKIAPVIAAKFPILEARKANELLESGQVVGNIVLLAPEVL